MAAIFSVFIKLIIIKNGQRKEIYIACIVLTTATFGLLDKKKNICTYLKGSSELQSQALKINYPEIFLYTKMHTAF